MRKNPPAPEPESAREGADLYRLIRAAFVQQGRTMQAFADSQGVTHQNCRRAIIGDWKGPKAGAIRAAAIAAAGLDMEAAA